MAKIQKTIYWMPRILGIFMILFISLFAFDVFEQGYSLQETLIAFLMHLVPTYILLVILLIAWKWQRLGAFLYLFLSFSYFIMTSGKESWLAYLFISGPLLLLFILFLLSAVVCSNR